MYILIHRSSNTLTDTLHACSLDNQQYITTYVHVYVCSNSVITDCYVCCVLQHQFVTARLIVEENHMVIIWYLFTNVALDYLECPLFHLEHV